MELKIGQGDCQSTYLSLDDPFSVDRLSLLQRKLAICHWRGLEEEAKSSLQEYHQLVEALYFNRPAANDKSL